MSDDDQLRRKIEPFHTQSNEQIKYTMSLQDDTESEKMCEKTLSKPPHVLSVSDFVAVYGRIAVVVLQEYPDDFFLSG